MATAAFGRASEQQPPQPPQQPPQQQQQADQEEPPQPYVLIIGGGQAGLALGARLSLLSVPYLIVESAATAGASWRARYPSLCLHDPVS